MVGKYSILINILDKIREESAGTKFAKYLPQADKIESINNARSRAYIHLYLKVKFGILDFTERERWIVDGSYDGGIDAYFINKETKSIYLIQSKFRTTEQNFEEKEIDILEILSMDIDRILKGQNLDEEGNEYNGKIKQLQREISEIEDIGRYSYKVVLLANLKDQLNKKLRALTGELPVEVFNFSKTYEELVFPVVSGTYFTASDITIPVDLSNKSAGSKISYTVTTKASDCEITVLFVPAIEIAKVMSKYKNSILQFNPRSYLDLEGQNVNSAIRETITNINTNEFALFNNGITILSDETSINERVGRQAQARLLIKNPQIINGGQTSYTLSRIYEERKDLDATEVFQGKEVLLKIITLIDNDSAETKQQLIDEISNATNKQTPVVNADRFANDTLHKNIQKLLFDRYGFLYERKRGEFSDGMANRYIDQDLVIERNLLFRLYYAGQGKISLAVQKRLFQKNEFPGLSLDDANSFESLHLAIRLHEFYKIKKNRNQRFSEHHYAKLYAGVLICKEMRNEPSIDMHNKIEIAWKEFIETVKHVNPQFLINRKSGRLKDTVSFGYSRYFSSESFKKDISTKFIPFFKKINIESLEELNT